ncbi:MAG: hypothetical protein Q9165_008747, partial [Trypethelium subeluteriae]
IFFVHPMKSKKYKAQRAQCIEVLKSAEKDVQVEGFAFEQSRKALQKNHYIQDLSTSLLELLSDQQYMTGAVEFIFIAFSIGEWVVQDALTQDTSTQDTSSKCRNIAKKTKSFVLKLESSAEFADLKSDFEKKNRESIETLEDKFRQLISSIGRETGHDPTGYTADHILQKRLTTDVALYRTQQLAVVYDQLMIKKNSERQDQSELHKGVELRNEDISQVDAPVRYRGNTISTSMRHLLERSSGWIAHPRSSRRASGSIEANEFGIYPNRRVSHPKKSHRKSGFSTENPLNGHEVWLDEPDKEVSQDVERLKSQFALAQSLHEGGDLSEAFLCCNRIIETLGKTFDAQTLQQIDMQLLAYEVKREKYIVELHRGLLQQAERHFRDAEEEVRENQSLGPRHYLCISFRSWKAVALIKNGPCSKVLADFISPKQDPAKPCWSSYVAGLGLWENALNLNRSLALAQNGNYGEAIKIALKYLQQDQNNRRPPGGLDKAVADDELTSISFVQYPVSREASARMKFELASIYYLAERFKDAWETNEEVLLVMKDYLGKSHYETLASASLRCALLAANGSVDEAEIEAIQTLKIIQLRLEPSHPITLRHLTTLAAIFRSQGRFSKAKASMLRLCGEYDDHLELGSTHPDAMEAKNELCMAQLALGQIAAASQTQKRVLEVARQNLRADHPILARYYQTMSRVRFAEQLSQEALEYAFEAFKTHRGSGSKDLSLSLSESRLETEVKQLLEDFDQDLSSWPSLLPISILRDIELIALAKHELGNDNFALDLLNAVLSIRLRERGKGHPETISAQLELGVLCVKMGDVKTGFGNLEKASGDASKFLGEFHPVTLRARHELSRARYYPDGFDTGKLDWIKRERTEILQVRLSILGEGHPDTINSWLDTAQTYCTLGHHSDARDLQRNAVDSMEKFEEVFGPHHDKTLQSQLQLASLELEHGHIDRAIALQEKVDKYSRSTQVKLQAKNLLARIECICERWDAARVNFEEVDQNCSPDNPLWALNRSDHSLLLYSTGDYDQAEQIQEQLVQKLSSDESAMSSFDIRILSVRSHLAFTRRAKGKFGQSVSEMEEVHRLSQHHLGDNDPRTEDVSQVLKEWKVEREVLTDSDLQFAVGSTPSFEGRDRRSSFDRLGPRLVSLDSEQASSKVSAPIANEQNPLVNGHEIISVSNSETGKSC